VSASVKGSAAVAVGAAHASHALEVDPRSTFSPAIGTNPSDVPLNVMLSTASRLMRRGYSIRTRLSERFIASRIASPPTSRRTKRRCYCTSTSHRGFPGNCRAVLIAKTRGPGRDVRLEFVETKEVAIYWHWRLNTGLVALKTA